MKVYLNFLSYDLAWVCSFLLLFVNKAIFAPCDYGLCFFAKDHLTVFMWTHLWTLHFDRLIDQTIIECHMVLVFVASH